MSSFCKIGLHKWDGWKFIEHIELPTRYTDHGSIRVTHHGLNADYYERECDRCGAMQDKLDRANIMTRLIKSGEVKP